MTEHIPEQRYGPTSGVISGIVGLVVCAVVVGLAIADGLTSTSVRFILGAGASAVLIWAYLLRPRIILEQGGRTLLLRNPFVDRRVPLAAVKVVGVRTVTTVRTDEAAYDCVAVGHSVRKVVRGSGPGGGLGGRWFGGAGTVGGPPPAHRPRLNEMSTQDAMTEQVLYAADQARLHGHATEPVERRLALPELVLLVVFLVALVVAFLI
ncbi:MAG: hypothetical protein J7518_19795 [Nocardioidaceae bacterium]|nr:hypothetical protein [Nocardioidaceae bacterium]